jgi:(p)ppGpp synthase/HD superfamily hydrolase
MMPSVLGACSIERRGWGGRFMREDVSLYSSRLERALRRAAIWHRGQSRKQVAGEPPGAAIPYVQHLAAVAMILDRLGYPEDVVIAGLLHDAVEDTDASIEAIESEFGREVASLVAWCTERKTEPGATAKRPWIDRKTEHLDHLRGAPEDARAVVLADKLHNLLSMVEDHRAGRPVWDRFNAGPSEVAWYYGAMIETLRGDDPRLKRLADECGKALDEVRSIPGGQRATGG